MALSLLACLPRSWKAHGPCVLSPCMMLAGLAQTISPAALVTGTCQAEMVTPPHLCNSKAGLSLRKEGNLGHIIVNTLRLSPPPRQISHCPARGGSMYQLMHRRFVVTLMMFVLSGEISEMLCFMANGSSTTQPPNLVD
jgi:hypothetical protein